MIFVSNDFTHTNVILDQPLHIAATASSLGTLSSNNSVIDEESSVFSESIVSLFSAISSKNYGDGNCSHDSFDKVIKLLLKQYPQAAQIPHGRSGRLPLVLADRAGNRSWNDGMRTLLRAYPPAFFSGSKGMIPVKLYPNVLSLIGGGNPPEMPPQKCAGLSNFPNVNAMSSFHRSCSINRFKGRGDIGLLNNLVLLKQRHMKELMASSSETYSANGNIGVGKQQNNDIPNSDVQSTESESFRHYEVVSRADGNHQFTNQPSSRLLSSPYKNSSGISHTPERKKRKELATTMFELLRAKPDLIEASRSHQTSFKSDSCKVRCHQGKLSLVGTKSTQTSTHMIHYSDKREQCQRQRLSGGPKKNTSRKLAERMKVFERKSWMSE
jgi:hypothetical protein